MQVKIFTHSDPYQLEAMFNGWRATIGSLPHMEFHYSTVCDPDGIVMHSIAVFYR